MDLDRLTASIGIEIADCIGRNWDEWFGLLLRFKDREGHCRVPTRHREGTFVLGQWVTKQRRRTLSVEQKRRLDDIGFDWDPEDSSWEEAFAALTRFKLREGHCRVPYAHREGELRLGVWVGNLRQDTPFVERKKRLDDIGFVWNQLDSSWNEAFAALSRFKSREGHCRVPKSHREGELRLGLWVVSQRQGTLSGERKKRLDDIGFVWDPLDSSWEKAFSALRKFKSREGHCRVPMQHREGEIRLGLWVNYQRNRKEIIPPERKKRLDTISFEWSSLADASWEAGFAALEQFKEREGHCRVPREHTEGELKLGTWVSSQRQITPSVERKKRLDDIGFVWDPLDNSWEEAFAALSKFKSREGHCLVPTSHMEEGLKLDLGTWVLRQRRPVVDTLSVEQKKRLDEIGFVWSLRDRTWEEAFAALEQIQIARGALSCSDEPHGRRTKAWDMGGQSAQPSHSFGRAKKAIGRTRLCVEPR